MHINNACRWCRVNIECGKFIRDSVAPCTCETIQYYFEYSSFLLFSDIYYSVRLIFNENWYSTVIYLPFIASDGTEATKHGQILSLLLTQKWYLRKLVFKVYSHFILLWSIEVARCEHGSFLLIGGSDVYKENWYSSTDMQ